LVSIHQVFRSDFSSSLFSFPLANRRMMIPKKSALIKAFVFLMLISLPISPIVLGSEERQSYRDQLYSGVTMRFEHRHLEKQKVTGHTRIDYQRILQDGSPFWLETQRNSQADGTVYSEKKTWFDPDSGVLMRYQETDFRTGVTISDTIEQGRIITRVQDRERSKQLESDWENDLILFETLALSLRRMLPDILQKGQTSFALYLPVLAIELDKNHLPLSLSKLEMTVRLETQGEMETPFGRRAFVQLLLKPASFLVSSLLPKEKTEFRFRFLTQPPYHLVAFEENQTRSVLIEMTPLP